MTTWIVITDSVRARVFSADRLRNQWKEVHDLCNTEARLLEQELVSDTKGRVFDSKGKGRHDMEPKQSAKRQVKMQFADLIAEYLNQQFSSGRFHRLVLAAPARLLGQIERQLHQKCYASLYRKYAKDFTKLSVDQLRQAIIES